MDTGGNIVRRIVPLNIFVAHLKTESLVHDHKNIVVYQKTGIVIKNNLSRGVDGEMSKDQDKRDYAEHLKGYVALYFDDLQKIVNIISKASKDVKIRYKNEDFENLEEVTVLGKERIKSIEIRTYDPYISLEIEKRDIVLYIDDKTPLQIQIFNEIKRFLKTRPRITELRLGKAVIIIGSIAGISLFGIETLRKYMSENLFYVVFGICVTFTSSAFWLAFFEEVNLIYTTPKHESPNQNKRFAILIVIAILIGIVATIIARNERLYFELY